MTEPVVADRMDTALVRVGPTTSVSAARAELDAAGATALVVSDGARVLGLLDRLALAALVDDGADPTQVKVEDGLAGSPATVQATDPLATAETAFASTGMPALLVLDGGSVVGILTAADRRGEPS